MIFTPELMFYCYSIVFSPTLTGYIWYFFKLIMKHYVQMSLDTNNDIEHDNIHFFNYSGIYPSRVSLKSRYLDLCSF